MRGAVPAVFLCVGCAVGAVSTLIYPVWIPISSALLGLIATLAAYMLKMGVFKVGADIEEKTNEG